MTLQCPGSNYFSFSAAGGQKGAAMELGKNNPLVRFKHLFIIYGVIIVVVLLVFFTNVFETKEAGAMPPFVWLLVAILFMIPLMLIFATLMKMLDVVDNSDSKLEKVADELERMRQVLNQVNQSIHVSETAKSIAFRDSDTQTLRDAVFDKLQQKDFESAYEIIDDIAHRTGYIKLAEQLHVQADKYRDATDIERMNQLITHIGKHLDDHQWSKASAQIEGLIREYPTNDKALAMRQRLAEKKDERKKVLLNSWDDAVKRQATDRSLEILRELDLYLTPNEALALQEAARDVFRSKLHNLGVQFSLAISGKQWAKALETAMEIIRDFPNSRMAEEIREKLDVLKTHAQQQP
jgi:energy-coupling factor transporter transmembrane protein EcfT